MSFSLSPSSARNNGQFIGAPKNGFGTDKTIPLNTNDILEKKVSTSLDFETDLNLLSKYGYSTNAQGNSASLSWELPEADFVNFMTNLPQQNNSSNNNGLKELGLGFLESNDADNGEITDEYGVCSIINSEHNPEVILHEFDEDLLQRDETSQDRNGLTRQFISRVPFESKLLNFRTSPKPLLKSEENIGSSEAEMQRFGASKEIQMSSSAPTTITNPTTLNGVAEVTTTDDDRTKGIRGRASSKRTSQSSNSSSNKTQPKVRMSLAQFLTVTSEESNDEQCDGEDEEEVSNVLWVGNIGPDVREEELREDFGAFGPINDIKILRESFCAFINFQEVTHAVNAKRELNGEIFGTQYIVIKYRKANQKYLNSAAHVNGTTSGTTSSSSFGTTNAPVPVQTKPPPDTTGNRIVTNPACSSLWVGNLSDDVTKSELFEEFSRFGPIESIRMLSHCAFINFSTVEHATAALVAMQAKQLGQLNIKINYGRTRHPTIASSSYDEDELKREELMMAGLNLSSSPSLPPQSQFQSNSRIVPPKTHNFLSSSTGSLSISPQLSTSPLGLLPSRSPPLLSQVAQAEIDPFLHPYPYNASTQSSTSPSTNFGFYKPPSVQSNHAESTASAFDDELLAVQQQQQLHLQLQLQQQHLLHQQLPTHHLHHQLQANSTLQKPQPTLTKQQMYTLFNNNSNSHGSYPFQTVNQSQIPYQSQFHHQSQIQKQTLSQSLPAQYPSPGYSSQHFAAAAQHYHRSTAPQSAIPPFQQSQAHYQATQRPYSQPQQIMQQRAFAIPGNPQQQQAYHPPMFSQSYDSAYSNSNSNSNNSSQFVDESSCLLCGSGEAADAIFLPCHHRFCSKCVAKLRFTKERKCPFCSEFVVKVLSLSSSTTTAATSASPTIGSGYE
eukprot:TRINITY_DN564_c0_g1_i1.p1 TRINITY_DN564_c0_g1~~TRINITY_DN564_c0_g1_i1.p1  ORF type:complete len:895 (+),score=225.47 TRINITY_DN564_c0_g1_i1:252-2936(+)